MDRYPPATAFSARSFNADSATVLVKILAFSSRC
jgi:hypothetical protein